MAKILQIETATSVCSVALAINGQTAAVKEESGTNLHASHITLFIEEVMREAKLQYTDLDAIAISKGPGSYTGLRIGVSTAKGLCYALGIPLIAIETLEMMTAGYLTNHPEFIGLVCPMIDARRMEVFTAVFNSNMERLHPTSARIIDENSFQGLGDKQLVFIGDGASKCEAVIKQDHIQFDAENYNSAAYMSKISEQAFTGSKFEDVAYFEPYYLKDFVFTPPKKKV